MQKLSDCLSLLFRVSLTITKKLFKGLSAVDYFFINKNRIGAVRINLQLHTLVEFSVDDLNATVEGNGFEHDEKIV